MRNTLLCFLILNFFGLSLCAAQSPCVSLQRQGVDSLWSFILTGKKDTAALKASLRLEDEAIRCDSSFFLARNTRLRILEELGDNKGALDAIDDLVHSSLVDSSFLVNKPYFYQRLGMYDTAWNLYKALSVYFEKRLKEDPERVDLIYFSLYTKFKVVGWEVRTEIDFYKNKYHDNPYMLALLKTIPSVRPSLDIWSFK